jgi:tetratricopeptide (TPR) repeat protein
LTAAPLLRVQRAIAILALLACVAGSQALVDQYRLAVNDEAGVTFSVAALVVRSFLGEVRGLAADFLWLRVDEYQHRRRIVGGNLLEQDDEALMPLVRLITWLDPHFVDAYALGGQWLAFHFSHPQQAVAFYEEGIRNNPNDFDLHTGAAWVYWRWLHNYARATTLAQEAAGLAGDDLERFQALWLVAHIRMTADDIPGALHAWREVGQIPGYDAAMKSGIQRTLAQARGKMQ